MLLIYVYQLLHSLTKSLTKPNCIVSFSLTSPNSDGILFKFLWIEKSKKIEIQYIIDQIYLSVGDERLLLENMISFVNDELSKTN